MGLRGWGLGADSGAIHGLCPGFLLPPIVDLLLGREGGRGWPVLQLLLAAGAHCA